MAKRICKDYMDIVTVLDNHDREQDRPASLNLTKGSTPWLNKVVSTIAKIMPSSRVYANEEDLRRAIKKEYGKLDDRKLLATKFIALLEAHPGLADIMEDFITLEASLLKDPKLAYNKDEFGNLTLDLSSLPINVLRNSVNELQALIRQGTGENLGKRWLRGALGPLDLQIILPKTMARKEATGAIYNIVQATKAFPRNQANNIARFSKADFTKEDFVLNEKGVPIPRKYGMDDILESIDRLSFDPSLSKLKNPANKKVLNSMFTWYNVRDDMYNRRLTIDDEGNMMIASNYTAARDDKGNLIFWDKQAEGLSVRSTKYTFTNYVPVEEYYGKNHVPMTPKMIKDFKKQSLRYEGLHKNVWDFLNKEFDKSTKELYEELKGLVPSNWTLEDISALFFGKDPTEFIRTNRKTGVTVSWNDLNPEQQDLVKLLHTHATKYNVLKPFIFNAKHEEEGPSEGRQSFPIIYNQMKFSFMWDEMIFEYNKRKEEIERELDRLAKKKTLTKEEQELKFNLKQEKKILVSILKRAEWIRDRKDDYPVDMGTGTYLALGDDTKHIKHISNAFNILEARSDKGTYYRYLQHNMAALERNRFTTTLIKNMKRARSEEVQNYILNLYKVALYQPDAASGFSWLKWDSDTVSRTFGRFKINISAATIDRKMRKILSFISGNLLRGVSTAVQNYTAIGEKFIDIGTERVVEALELIETGGKAVERLISLSGVVDFREFFSSSLTSDANNLGAENKQILKLTEAMIRYWAKVNEATSKLPKRKLSTSEKLAFEKLKRQYKKELEQEFGRTLKTIPTLSRLKKRKKVLRDLHHANILRKWVDYAINKEYEAADYIKAGKIKSVMKGAEIIARFERQHLPTMGKTEQSLRSLSFIIGIRNAMRAGFLPDIPIEDLLKNPKLLQEALDIGVSYTELLDFGLSRQDLGQIGASNIGAFFTQFKVWAMQKFGKDLSRIRLAYQEMRNDDNKHFDLKAMGKMLESLVRYKKYSIKKLRDTSPRLASYRAWFLTQGLWTVLWDFGIMGPILLIPGMKSIFRSMPFTRAIGGSTSDLVSWIMLLPGIAVALSFGEGEDNIEKIFDYYFRKTMFGMGARWSVDFVLAILAMIDADDDEERNNKIDRVLSPVYPPIIKESRIIRHLLPKE